MEQPNAEQNNLNGSRGVSKRQRGNGRGSQKAPKRNQQQAHGVESESLVVIPRFETFIKSIHFNQKLQQNVDMSHLNLWHPLFGIVEGELLDGFVLTVTASNSNAAARGVAYKPGCFRNGNGVATLNDIPPSNYALNVGQLLFGVVDEENDEAFLASFRSINCETALRGKVFKPQHFTPITREGDDAIGVPFAKQDKFISMFNFKACSNDDK